MKWFRVCFFVIVVLIVLAYLSGGCSSVAAFEVGEEIVTPKGYTLVGASAYGRFFNIRTFYYQNDESGRIYTYEDGVFKKEIVLPDGYSFVGASAYGRLANILTIYCRQDDTGRIFVLNPM